MKLLAYQVKELQMRVERYGLPGSGIEDLKSKFVELEGTVERHRREISVLKGALTKAQNLIKSLQG